MGQLALALISWSSVAQILGALGAATVIGSVIVALVNHLLTNARAGRAAREKTAGVLRKWADDWSDLNFRYARIHHVATAQHVPIAEEALKLLENRSDEIDRLTDQMHQLEESTRPPESLVTHTRLFMRRLWRSRQGNQIERDLATRALVEFRRAVDEYVRSGRVKQPTLQPGESMPEGEAIPAEDSS